MPTIAATTNEYAWGYSASGTPMLNRNHTALTPSYGIGMDASYTYNMGLSFSLAMPVLAPGYTRNFTSLAFYAYLKNPDGAFTTAMTGVSIYVVNVADNTIWQTGHTPMRPADYFGTRITPWSTSSFAGASSVQERAIDLSTPFATYVSNWGMWANSTRRISITVNASPALLNKGMKIYAYNYSTRLELQYSDVPSPDLKHAQNVFNGGVNSGFGRGGQL